VLGAAFIIPRLLDMASAWMARQEERQDAMRKEFLISLSERDAALKAHTDSIATLAVKQQDLSNALRENTEATKEFTRVTRGAH
jgi:hypothetical protein